MSTIRTLAIALTAALALTACKDKKSDAEPAAAAKTGEKTAGEAKAPAKKGGVDFAALQAKIAAAKGKEDIDAAFDACMSAMIDLGLNAGIKEPDKDPDYRATCKVGLARQRAKLVVADSTPDKMNTMCLTASMQLEELGNEGGPEAAEMKQLMADVNKACGL